MTDRQRVITVFLPAFNEEETIGEVIRRVPRSIANARVEVIVIDDGSTDRSREVALASGADEVITFKENRGLGAAVREGLRQCCLRGADVGVMIDADNEYPPESIPALVLPILAGFADYTIGSRFLGQIHGMKLHRRIGNYIFTMLQSLLLRQRLHDGQSGMRAFSRTAMEQAEIIHDYNYAQVLTLNLLRKGFRLLELPIQYQVRTKGKSFIRFGQYVGSVLPAMLREMNRPVQKTKS